MLLKYSILVICVGCDEGEGPCFAQSAVKKSWMVLGLARFAARELIMLGEIRNLVKPKKMKLLAISQPPLREIA